MNTTMYAATNPHLCRIDRIINRQGRPFLFHSRNRLACTCFKTNKFPVEKRTTDLTIAIQIYRQQITECKRKRRKYKINARIACFDVFFGPALPTLRVSWALTWFICSISNFVVCTCKFMRQFERELQVSEWRVAKMKNQQQYYYYYQCVKWKRCQFTEFYTVQQHALINTTRCTLQCIPHALVPSNE